MANDPYKCPQAIRHSPANGRGRCDWCGRKIEAVAPKPRVREPSELTESYGEYYDPDYGAIDRDEIRHRYETGQT